MCQQCHGIDDEDDLDQLAAAFVARQQKPIARAAPAPHALVYRKAPSALPTKEKPHG